MQRPEGLGYVSLAQGHSTTMKTVADAIEGRMADEHEAVILAAGPAAGFGSLTTNKHKCMLDVGGTTIIEHQIENFVPAGIPSRRLELQRGEREEAS